MEWENQEGKLTKEFTFEDFNHAIAFIVKIALEAEQMNHHPDINLYSYNKVKITLFTYSENKITEKDHELAKKIDEL